MHDRLFDKILEISALSSGTERDKVFLSEDKVLLLVHQRGVVGDPGLQTAPISPGWTIKVGDRFRFQQQLVYDAINKLPTTFGHHLLTVIQQLLSGLLEYFLPIASPWYFCLSGTSTIVALFAPKLSLIALLHLPAIELVELLLEFSKLILMRE
jgi:hypothetical protein